MRKAVRGTKESSQNRAATSSGDITTRSMRTQLSPRTAGNTPRSKIRTNVEAMAGNKITRSSHIIGSYEMSRHTLCGFTLLIYINIK
jgi:hypothetical protein